MMFAKRWKKIRCLWCNACCIVVNWMLIQACIKPLLHSLPFMFPHLLFRAHITCMIKSQVQVSYEGNKRYYSATFHCVMKNVNFYIVTMVQTLRWKYYHRFIVCKIFCNITSAYLVKITNHSFHWKTNLNCFFF